MSVAEERGPRFGSAALARVLERAFRDALDAVDVEERVSKATRRLASHAAEVRIVAVGKAAPAMTRGAMRALGDRVVRALVVVPDGTLVDGLPRSVEIVRAAHPLPDARSVVAAERAFSIAREAGRAKNATLLALVSGGASSLLCAPYRVPLTRKVELVRALLHARATISEVNLVRRHASRIKGGGLLLAGAPSNVVTLVVSDVIGGAAYDVASGPTLPDPTTRADARSVLERYSIARVPLRESLSPNSRDATRSVLRIVASPRDLATAMRRALIDVGFDAQVLPARTGDIDRFVASYAALARTLEAGEALLRVAEPTLRVAHARPGRGGRASHLSALVAPMLPRGVTFAAIASDGVDGSSAAAGAIVDARSWSRLSARTIERALTRFDTATLHARAGTAVAGGASGHNFADVHVLVRCAP